MPNNETFMNILHVRYEEGGPWIDIPALKGNGIQSIVFDSTTKIITITETSGTVTQIDALQDAYGDVQELISEVEASEALRTAAETQRVSAEAGRVSAESARAASETSRVSAEAARASAETARAGAETARNTAEGQRTSAETTRQTQESSRVSAESARVTAENARVAAETLREETFDSWDPVLKGNQAEKTAEMTQPIGIDENGKLWGEGGGDAGKVTYDPEEEYEDGTVGSELDTQSQQIDNLKSSDIQFASDHMRLYRDADGDLCEL